MKTTFKANHKCEDWKKTFEMNVNWLRGDDGKTCCSAQDISVKKKGPSGYASKLKASEKAAKYESEFNISNFSNEDRTVSMKFEGESKPAKKDFHWTTTWRLAVPHFNDNLGFWKTFSVTCGTDKQLKGSWTLVSKFDKHALGVKVTGDIKQKQKEEVHVHATSQINDDLVSFMKFNQAKNQLTLGSVFNSHSDYFSRVGAQATIDMNRDEQGNLQDKTLSLVTETKWDSNSTVRVKTDIGNKITMTGGLIHRVNDFLTLKAFDTIQPFQAYQNKNIDTYNFGVAMEFEFNN